MALQDWQARKGRVHQSPPNIQELQGNQADARFEDEGRGVQKVILTACADE